ncbi:transmembrane protein 71 isoform X4 [Lagopus muta]|uniref:transmembrane protein 71 isoform X4 n=1 Tax=Lagopus muta TaxID=64668 RepID=UPI00209F4A80|nr:transmembrane protein 71 isoform X4 [Lagopus muta]
MNQSFSRCMECHMLQQHHEEVNLCTFVWAFDKNTLVWKDCGWLTKLGVQQCLMENTSTASQNIFIRVMLARFSMMALPTEDSFLSDEDGNITLSPSQTSVTYKENSVRIFRRRKKMRGSLASLFSFSASSQWLSSTILNTMDSSHVDDPWLDKCSELQPSQTDTDNSDLSCEYNILVPQGQIPASIGASLTKDEEFIEPGKSLCASPSCSPFIINGNKDTLNKAESNSVPNFLAQIAALMVCLIISVCTRYFLGGFSAILLLIILAFLVSQDAALSSFFSLVTSFKTTNFEEALGASGRHSHLHCDKGTDCSTSQTTQHEVKVLCIAEDS